MDVGQLAVAVGGLFWLSTSISLSFCILETTSVIGYNVSDSAVKPTPHHRLMGIVDGERMGRELRERGDSTTTMSATHDMTAAAREDRPAATSPSIGRVVESPYEHAVAVTPTTDDSSAFIRRRMGEQRQRLAPRHLVFSQDVPPSTSPRSGPSDHTSAQAAVVTPVTPSVQYYAVARGRCVGVYHSHAEVVEETRDYRDSVYRVCKSAQEAERFIDRYLDLTMGRRGDPDPRHRSTLVAFCDGTVLGGRYWSHRTGVACLFPHNADWDVVFTCEDMYCTEYRASTKAALAAVQRANMEDPSQQRVLYVFTRNQLLVRAMTEWIDKWLENDWVKGDGEPVKNKDVLRHLVEAQGKRRIIWKLEDHWASEWTTSAVSAAEDAALAVHELFD